MDGGGALARGATLPSLADRRIATQRFPVLLSDAGTGSPVPDFE